MIVALNTDIQKALLQYVLQQADTNLILAQRLCEWCGHGPVLEQDIAMSNIGLDLLGQTRSLYQYAAVLQGKGRTEDDLAVLRGERHFTTLLLVEQLNGDFGCTVVRQFFYEVYHFYLLQQLVQAKDEQLAAIAEKSLKEVTYHLKWTAEWVIRLGDGTGESRRRVQQAVNDLWMFTGEMFLPTPAEQQLAEAGIIPDITMLKGPWLAKVSEILATATLDMPDPGAWMQQGGKKGIHTEHLGYLLAEMQSMQREYPGMKW
jgi:ring-1,2-phenylacetyl-CoA epoxidase subunit PaaC